MESQEFSRLRRGEAPGYDAVSAAVGSIHDGALIRSPGLFRHVAAVWSRGRNKGIEESPGRFFPLQSKKA